MIPTVLFFASVLLAAFVPGQRMHEPCAQTLAEARLLVISPFVLAELDCLTARIAGVDAELAVLDERHFRVVQSLRGKPFRILSADIDH